MHSVYSTAPVDWASYNEEYFGDVFTYKQMCVFIYSHGRAWVNVRFSVHNNKWIKLSRVSLLLTFCVLISVSVYIGLSLSISQLVCRWVSSWCYGWSDGLRNRSKRVRTPVALLRSLSGKYSWKLYETPYPISYGLNSTTSVFQGEWFWH